MGLVEHFPFTKINKEELICELFLKYYIYFSIIKEICNNQ